MVSSKHHLYRITLIECVDIYKKSGKSGFRDLDK